jgi:hypothetical protein
MLEYRLAEFARELRVCIHRESEKAHSRKPLKKSDRDIIHRNSRGRMPMQPRKEITRRSFLKLGFAGISAIALVFVAGCAGGGDDDDDDDDGGRRRR